MDNMVEGTTNKILTQDERDDIASNTSDVGKVNVSAADTTKAYIATKITPGIALQTQIANPGADEDLVFNVIQSEISHENIANIGTNTHTDIDTHIANTSNPHSVSLEQARAIANILNGNVDYNDNSIDNINTVNFKDGGSINWNPWPNNTSFHCSSIAGRCYV